MDSSVNSLSISHQVQAFERTLKSLLIYLSDLFHEMEVKTG